MKEKDRSRDIERAIERAEATQQRARGREERAIGTGEEDPYRGTHNESDRQRKQRSKK